MNVFRESSAPYVLVLLIGLVGWLFNSALESARDLRILEYRSEYGSDGAVNTVTYRIENRSMAAAINAGQFTFRCPTVRKDPSDPAKTCLAVLPSVGSQAQYLGSSNLGLPESVLVSGEGVSVNARIPPRGELGIRIGIKAKDTKLTFAYILSEPDIQGDRSSIQVRIRQSGAEHQRTLREHLDDVTVFVISNYLTLLVLALLVLLSTIALYFLFVIILASTAKREEKKEIFQVTINGETRIVAVEKE